MDVVVEALREPERVRDWPLPRWEVLIGQARRANVLARLAVTLAERSLLPLVPEPPRAHLTAARRLAERQRQEVRWEVDRIRRALAEVGLRCVLLKGAAYMAAGLPCARGRLLSDVDILVPRHRLAEAERALFRHGWVTTHLDAYDQRYYRTWMHELPPMRHVRRQTVLDVHHSITPLSSRYPVAGDALLADARPLPPEDGLWVLAPVDQVIHSATHLILEGELDNGLRDLVDLADLAASFGEERAFWPSLVQRAAALGLLQPLCLALDLAHHVLGVEVPGHIRGQAPPGLRRAALAGLFRAALRPRHPSCDNRLAEGARWLLYVRGHYLRMPLRLLIPHLTRKGWRRPRVSA